MYMGINKQSKHGRNIYKYGPQMKNREHCYVAQNKSITTDFKQQLLLGKLQQSFCFSCGDFCLARSPFD